MIRYVYVIKEDEGMCYNSYFDSENDFSHYAKEYQDCIGVWKLKKTIIRNAKNSNI